MVFSTSEDFHNAVVLWMALIFPSCLPMTFWLTTLTVRVGIQFLCKGWLTTYIGLVMCILDGLGEFMMPVLGNSTLYQKGEDGTLFPDWKKKKKHC